MDEALQRYLQSVEEEASQYKKNELTTKEYLASMQEMEQWLKERCDADSNNQKV